VASPRFLPSIHHSSSSIGASIGRRRETTVPLSRTPSVHSLHGHRHSSSAISHCRRPLLALPRITRTISSLCHHHSSSSSSRRRRCSLIAAHRSSSLWGRRTLALRGPSQPVSVPLSASPPLHLHPIVLSLVQRSA
ncbi:hypothetical protein PFISCL1PPCAC_22281, partial [Pristionchus fissidentatus]